MKVSNVAIGDWVETIHSQIQCRVVGPSIKSYHVVVENEQRAWQMHADADVVLIDQPGSR